MYSFKGYAILFCQTVKLPEDFFSHARPEAGLCRSWSVSVLAFVLRYNLSGLWLDVCLAPPCFPAVGLSCSVSQPGTTSDTQLSDLEQLLLVPPPRGSLSSCILSQGPSGSPGQSSGPFLCTAFSILRRWPASAAPVSDFCLSAQPPCFALPGRLFLTWV